MRISRRLAILLVLLSSVLEAGAAAGAPERAKTPPAETKAAAVPDMAFYLAHGEADVCGRGCSEWIAAEGRIDAGAAQRLRRLLARLGPAASQSIFIRRAARCSARLPWAG